MLREQQEMDNSKWTRFAGGLGAWRAQGALHEQDWSAETSVRKVCAMGLMRCQFFSFGFLEESRVLGVLCWNGI